MYSRLKLVLILLATYLISAYALEDTFAGVKLYNTLEKSLFSRYGVNNGASSSRQKTEPVEDGLESILDENYPKHAPDFHENNLYSQPDHNAFIKISNALYKRPVSAKYGAGVKDEHSKKILNRALVAQLQSLLDSIKILSMNDEVVDNGIITSHLPKPTAAAESPEIPNVIKNTNGQPKEHLFLVLNDDLKTVTNDELIYVDPNSLSLDCTVFVLGSLNDVLSNDELVHLMQSVQAELLKPKYLPLLFTLSSGSKLQSINAELGPNILSGLNARRYVKAHRCNYQSPLAKIKNGGPMWVICSGYININTPSYYDK